MKKNFFQLFYGVIAPVIPFALLAGLLCVGCVHLPSVTPRALPQPGLSQIGSDDANSGVDGRSATLKSALRSAPQIAAQPKPNASPAHVAIQHTVNWAVTLIILASVAAIGFGAFLCYGGNYWTGGKFIGGGFVTIIGGIWFAYHWALIIGLGIAGLAVYEIILHWTVVKPILQNLEVKIISGLNPAQSKNTPPPPPA